MSSPVTRSAATPDLRDFLQRQPLFDGMSVADLDRLLALSYVVQVPQGQALFEEGDDGHAMYVVIDGKLEISKQIDGRTDILAVRTAGDVIGEMSVLSAAPRVATASALERATLLEVGDEAFQTLLSCSGAAAATIVQTMSSRLRTTEAALQQHERLASLGTMAAGLAHELNNPAAAVARAAAQLREALDAGDAALFAFVEAGVGGDAIAALRSAHGDLVARTSARAAGVEQAGTGLAWRKEDALRDMLERLGVPLAWELAPSFAAAGLEGDSLASLLQSLPAAGRPAAARFLASAAEARLLLRDTATAAKAISSIVHAVKSYSYLDQAPIQEIDLHEGIEDTLVILHHKLKQGVKVTRAYAAGVPRIEAYGSELNQVWTNLIDNAVDAMEGEGTLRIATTLGRANISVEICDDGPGVPPELASKIFDPFFTTKALGKGTGLGLHTVHRIVERHGGTVALRPNPGGRGTCACVVLPMRASGGNGRGS